MADDLEDRFEEDDEDNIEIMVMGDNDPLPKEESEEVEDDGKVVLTREEYAKLQGGADSTLALKSSFDNFASRLEQQRPANDPRQQQGETEEEFLKRLEDQAFTPGGFGKSLKEGLERLAGPVIAARDQEIASLQRRVAAKESGQDVIFTKYGAEIDAELAKFPLHERGKQQAIDYVVNKVKLNHFQDEVNDAVAAALAKQQEAPATNGKSTVKPTHSERGAGPSSVGGPKKVTITESEVRAAKLEGFTKEEYARLPDSAKKIIRDRWIKK